MRAFVLLLCILAHTLCWAYPDIQNLEDECTQLFASDMEWLNAQETSLAELQKIRADKKKVKELYTKISALTMRIEKPTTIGLKEENRLKNRNTYFVPFDFNIPCHDELPEFYISGSEVSTPYQKYLLVQAPIAETIPDFWKMILIKKCPLIVTIATPYEGSGRNEKCTPYWLITSPLEVDGWSIARFEEDRVLAENPKKPAERIVQRLFLLTNVATHETRLVTQLHYEQWKDNGVPTLSLFQKLLHSVHDMHLPQDAPITVHCSAGVGRTGVFVLAYSLQQQIMQKKELFLCSSLNCNIPKFLLFLRLQRKSLLANTRQLQFVYQYLSETQCLDY